MRIIYSVILSVFSFYFASAQNPVADFTASDTATCENEDIVFTNHSTGATSYKWLFPGGVTSSDTASDSTRVWYMVAGYYTVTLIAYNGATSDTLTLLNYIHILPAPPIPLITQVQDTLFCSYDPSYISYQWYDDTMAIPGATNRYYVPLQTGNYNVQVTGQNGCKIAVGINIFEPPPVPRFTASQTTICAGDCISFTNTSLGAAWYEWYFPGATPSGTNDMIPTNICYSAPGHYDVTLEAGNPNGFAHLTRPRYITVNPLPPAPVIIVVQDTLYCSYDSSYAAYQWYAGATLITGATDSFLKISVSGNYKVQVTSHAGCTADTASNIALGLKNEFHKPVISLSPNPVENELRIKNSELIIERIIIYNVFGQACLQPETRNTKHETIADVSLLPPGIYFVQLTGEGKMRVEKFVKE